MTQETAPADGAAADDTVLVEDAPVEAAAVARDAPPERRLGLRVRGWTILGAAMTAAFLELAPRVGLVDSFSLVPLSAMVGRAAQLLVSPAFLTTDLLPSLAAIASSFVLATVIGVAVGLLIWAVPAVRHALDPWLATYYAIPTFALYPLLVVLMGVGAAPIILLGTLFAVVAMISATVDGLDGIPRTTLRLMRSLQMPRSQRITKVLIPAALPQISVGLRLALSYSIIMVLASEFVLSTRGLGHFISNAYNDFAITNMYAGVLLVFALALLLNVVFARVLTRSVDRKAP
jgi:NitT/TauT family transport system permease protein